MRSLFALLLLFALPALSSETAELFQGKTVPAPNERLHTQTQGDLVITTAVPSAAETREIFGTNLYQRNVQPVWVQVENRSAELLLLAPMGLDPDYFTARETAGRATTEQLQVSSRLLEPHSVLRMEIPPHSIHSAYIYTRVSEGTKSFNIDIVGGEETYQMSFFVPVPGLRLDHYRQNLRELYTEEDIRQVSEEELAEAIEAMPCCVSNSSGSKSGDPLNLVIIGHVQDLYYAFMRAGWDETETIYTGSLWKTFTAAIANKSYRHSPVSALYVFDRPQDVALQRIRSRIHERNHLRLWLTPMQLEGVPVWIGQISRDIGVRFTTSTITTHKIDPDVDETREFLLEDLAYSQSLEKFAYLGGVGETPYNSPRGNLTGDPWFSDGNRLVMWISRESHPIDDITRIHRPPFAARPGR